MTTLPCDLQRKVCEPSRFEVDAVMGRCDPGLKHVREMTVTQQDTAIAFGSGDVPVVSTPSLLALAEAACVDALAGEIPEDQTSVGAWAEIEHLQPTPVGAQICAKSTLIGHHGRRLEFNVIIEQDSEVIAKIRHRRVLVDRERFLARL